MAKTSNNGFPKMNKQMDSIIKTTKKRKNLDNHCENAKPAAGAKSKNNSMVNNWLDLSTKVADTDDG